MTNAELNAETTAVTKSVMPLPNPSRSLPLLLGLTLLSASPALAVRGGQTVSSAESTVALRVWLPDFLGGYYTSSCTGTLVAPRVVVTAAFCVVTPTFNNPVGANDIDVFAGGLNPIQGNDGQLHFVQNVHRHSGYEPDDDGDANGLAQRNDIAVLILEQAVTNVEPSPVLPLEVAQDLLALNPTLELQGYGATSEEGNPTSSLRSLPKTFVANNATEVRFNSMSSNAGGCMGDYGGPLLLDRDALLTELDLPVDETDPARFVLAAYGDEADYNDACNGDDVFTFLPAYLSFIEAAAGDLYVPWQPPEPLPEPEPEPEPEPTDDGGTPDPEPEAEPDAGPEDDKPIPGDPGEDTPEPETTDPEEDPVGEDSSPGPAPFDPDVGQEDDTPPEDHEVTEDPNAFDEGEFQRPKTATENNPRTFVVHDYEHDTLGGCDQTASSDIGGLGLLLLGLAGAVRRRQRG